MGGGFSHWAAKYVQCTRVQCHPQRETDVLHTSSAGRMLPSFAIQHRHCIKFRPCMVQDLFRKIPAPIKTKSALPPPPNPKSPPPPNPKSPSPPKKRGILWTWRFSCRKKAFFPGVHKSWRSNFQPQNCGQEFYGHEDFSDLYTGENECVCVCVCVCVPT